MRLSKICDDTAARHLALPLLIIFDPHVQFYIKLTTYTHVSRHYRDFSRASGYLIYPINSPILSPPHLNFNGHTPKYPPGYFAEHDGKLYVWYTVLVVDIRVVYTNTCVADSDTRSLFNCIQDNEVWPKDSPGRCPLWQGHWPPHFHHTIRFRIDRRRRMESDVTAPEQRMENKLLRMFNNWTVSDDQFFSCVRNSLTFTTSVYP
jgi:hypothetical protein